MTLSPFLSAGPPAEACTEQSRVGQGECTRGAGTMAGGRGEEARHDQGRDEEEEEEYIDMDLTFAAAGAAAGPGREFEFHHMSAPLDGRAGEPLLTLASPADELFYKGKLLPLHLPPRVRMVEDLLLDLDIDHRGRGRHHLAVSTAPATPCERSRGVSPANSCFVSGELNVEEFFRDYAAAGLAYADDGGASAAGAGEKRPPWSRRLRFVTRQLNLGRQLKASKAYLKTMFATTKPNGNADVDKNVLGANDLPHSHGHGGHHRAWRKNPFGQTRSNRCIAEKSGAGHAGAHRRSFSSVMVRYSASNETSPAPAPSSCSSTSSSSKSSTSTSSSVRSSSGSDGAGTPVLRRSSSASSEAENPIQGLIAYCKKSQQLASVRKSASDTGFRFLSSSAASKVAAESEGLDELIEICRG
uniref:Uncharacterized protein n=1 Tax=Avena sativa TaxID=4498 RepID=A0ACD5T9K9_AVESA